MEFGIMSTQNDDGCGTIQMLSSILREWLLWVDIPKVFLLL